MMEQQKILMIFSKLRGVKATVACDGRDILSRLYVFAWTINRVLEFPNRHVATE